MLFEHVKLKSKVFTKGSYSLQQKTLLLTA